MSRPGPATLAVPGSRVLACLGALPLRRVPGMEVAVRRQHRRGRLFRGRLAGGKPVLLWVALLLAMPQWPGTARAVSTVPPAENSELDPFLVPVEPRIEFDLDLLERRGRMLRWHETFAIASLVLLSAELAVGQVRLARDPQRRDLRRWQQGLELGALGTYAASAGLALAAPPVPRQSRWDAFSWHKGFAVVHGLGMTLTPLVGMYSYGMREAGYDGDRLRRIEIAHQTAGYVTWSALFGAAIVIAVD